MNLTGLKIASINRVIAHEIQPKTEKKDAYAVTRDELLVFNKAEKDILINRIGEAISNTTKTFQLDYEDRSDESLYAVLKDYDSITKKKFIDYSSDMANKLADAHFRIKIPGGYCLVGDGMTSSKKMFFFVIKAELQEVFNIEKNTLKVIKNVFLSPAKDFYKIGFFIQSGKSFIPFMYDDQFSLQKKDLTEYFYSNFLGLTTDKNDKLKTKNFYEDTKHFIETNIDNMKDRMGLIKALTVLYREEATGLISPKEFSDKYFEGPIKADYDRKIIQEKYPHSFTKDTSIIENRLELQRISIPLSYSLSIVGNSSDLADVDIISDPDNQTLRKIEPEINNGKIDKLIILRQVEQKEATAS